MGLVGESGCGKSTLGKTLLQLLPATSGSVTLRGEDVLGRKGDELKRLRRRMQIVFQDPVELAQPTNAGERHHRRRACRPGRQGKSLGNSSVRERRVGDYLETVGLRRDYARRFPHEFSGGQRQRIGIARALVLEPEFIVCDEPVSALDVSIQSQILNLLLDLRREFGLTYLFVAHNLSVVQYLSDRVGVMYLGKIGGDGTGRSAVRDPPASVHRGPAVSRPGARSASTLQATGAQGRCALTGSPPLGVPLPPPVLASRAAWRPGGMRDHGAAVPGPGRRPSGRVPLPRPDRG